MLSCRVPEASGRGEPEQTMSAVLSFVGSQAFVGSHAFVGPDGREALGGRYLGPATVTRIGAATLEAELPTGERVNPRLALAFPFAPAEGDTLLVIGQGTGAESRYFVIGVIESTGQTALHFRGDVEVRADGGSLELHGEHGVMVHGRQIDIKTKRLEVLADKATEAFGSVMTRVRSLLSVHVGDSDMVVHGEWSNRSKRASVTSQEVVSINGKEVHLG